MGICRIVQTSSLRTLAPFVVMIFEGNIRVKIRVSSQPNGRRKSVAQFENISASPTIKEFPKINSTQAAKAVARGTF